ncbi:MAG: hypothetical protein IIX14_02255 [Clostridia bacterium]|nr:hypothetical protein [Clostridia bacterium]
MKKIISVIISFVLILSCCSVLAGAAYEESLIFTCDISDSFIVDVKGEHLSSKAPSYLYQYDTQTYSLGYSCYDYLDEAQKYVYDSIVANVGKLSFTISFPNKLFAYSNFNNAYFTEIMHAVSADRPDVFYYAGYSIPGGTLYSGSEYLKTIDYSVQPYDSYYTNSNVGVYYNALMAAVSDVPVDLSNRYNFVKSVHDYLARTVYYPDLNSSDYVMSAHDAYGALVEGRAVCQGYSDAVKILCDYYKIPCVCISGTSDGYGHMWNAVQMDDGKWYLMDLTWDDQESITFYEFFLVGTLTKNQSFGRNEFCVDHVNDADLPMPLPILDYSKTAYIAQNHNTLFDATYNSAADFSRNLLCVSVFDAGKSNVYYNGIYVPVTSFENGTAFTAPTGAGASNEDWTMVILADSNGDGKCNATDYSACVNLMLSEDNSAQSVSELACDVNLDGYVDVLDCLVIAKASTGVDTHFELN